MPINAPDVFELELVYVIVNNGQGSKVLHIARQHGLTGGTILLGKGTVRNHLLEALALADVRKEIVLLLTIKKDNFNLLEILNIELRLDKPNHGIAFSIPICGVIGSKSFPCKDKDIKEGEEHSMYQSVFIIVDKGRGEAAVEAAQQAGTKGATIINGRGAGVHEKSKLFAMEIEPEKEIVVIILEENQTEQVVESLKACLDIDKPGNGIIFIQDVKQVFGLYQ